MKRVVYECSGCAPGRTCRVIQLTKDDFVPKNHCCDWKTQKMERVSCIEIPDCDDEQTQKPQKIETSQK